ncbi:MAG: hypothetical protein WBD13_21690 [Burkholderiaceae bacterium]
MTSTLINHGKTGKRVRKSAEQWREIVDRQRTSGLSQAAFCRQENLASATFYKWQNRLNQAATSAPWHSAGDSGHDLSAPFVSLGTVPGGAAPSTMTVRLDLGAGLVLEISRA